MSEVSIVATTQREDAEEEEENRKVWCVVCCNLIFFIIMIILLLLLVVRYNALEADGEDTVIPSYKPSGGGGGGGGATTGAAATDANTTSTEAATAPPTVIPPAPTVKPTTSAMTTSASPMPSTVPVTLGTTAAPAPTMSSRMPATNAPMPTTTTTTTSTTTTTAGPRSRNYTLICVFEALPTSLWNKSYSCTHYVYIRFFVYSTDPNPSMALVFEGKKRTDGPVHLYYDQSDAEWRPYSSYNTLDSRIKRVKHNHPNSSYFLGMWGAAYVRLMSGLWDPNTLREALHRTLRGNFSQRLNMSDFNGFAIINTIIQDTRVRGRAEPFSTIFRGTAHGAPILEPHWTFIHTAAIWPGGDAYIPEKMVSDILKEADIVGISTSNSTDEPNILMYRVRNTATYLAASPPNPIRPPGPNTRGMRSRLVTQRHRFATQLDILAEFPHWKQVLGRSRLCFSVTTAINYAYTSVDGIDFVRPVRNKEDVQRYSRRRFTFHNATVRYPVEDHNMVYYYDNITHTHYWRYPGPSGQLLKFFAYDDAVTLKYKVTELLRAYPSDKCVVFDDLGEDSLKANLTIGGRTYGFEPYAMFQAVVDVLNATTT